MITFPFDANHIHHKHGGHIVRVDGIRHETDKPDGERSRDWWEFYGMVAWTDGTTSEAASIPPWAIWTDTEEGREEISALLDAMTEYLRAHGEWTDNGWFANERPAKHQVRKACR